MNSPLTDLEDSLQKPATSSANSAVAMNSEDVTAINAGISPGFSAESPQHQLFGRILGRIRTCLDVETILQATVGDVRQFLDADRVGIFRFYPDRDWEGELIVEDVLAPWESVLEKPVQDHCFSQQFAPHYLAGRVNAICDVAAQDYQPCYLDVLQKFQIRANIVAPLRLNNQLWGLLCIHQCRDRRDWQTDEIAFVQQVAEQMSIALQQADAVQRLQSQAVELAQAKMRDRQAQMQQAIATIADKIRCSLELEVIFQTTTEELHQLLSADRVALYRFNPDWSGKFVFESVGPEWDSLIELQQAHQVIRDNVDACAQKLVPQADTHLQATAGGDFAQGQVVRVCDDIQQAGFSDCYRETLALYQARAYVIVAIYQGPRLWGLLAVFQNAGPRHWATDEIELLTQLGSQLSMALQQAEAMQQVKHQSAQLALAAQRQKSLTKTVTRIRQSLDIESIFQVTTREVRQLLSVDRVAIYRFAADWTGEFVADSMATDVELERPPIAPSSIACLLQSDIAVDQYPRHETFVPILQGDQLWGLLLAYQSDQPRAWSTDDTDLLAQVGGHLGIALQQAELLQTTRTQAAELAATLSELRRSQNQLIQGEKMASLGQMVAGIAHEINNPNNFILGNLKHFEADVPQILQALTLYGQEHTAPSSTLAEVLADLDLEFLQADVPAAINSMINGSERIRTIVQSLRTFSHLDQSHLKQVNLHKGLKSALSLVKHRFKLRQSAQMIQVSQQFGDIALVECFAADVNQVFLQLLNNAIDALHQAADADVFTVDRQPTLTIKTWQEKSDHILIMIADNGLGMPSDVQAKIFDPFFTTKSVGGGVGMGLSTSYQIIAEQHGGELYCTSTPGAGTEFYLRIPVRVSADLRASTSSLPADVIKPSDVDRSSDRLLGVDELLDDAEFDEDWAEID